MFSTSFAEFPEVSPMDYSVLIMLKKPLCSRKPSRLMDTEKFWKRNTYYCVNKITMNPTTIKFNMHTFRPTKGY